MQLLTDDLQTFAISVLLSNGIEITFMFFELRTTLIVRQTSDTVSEYVKVLASYFARSSKEREGNQEDKERVGEGALDAVDRGSSFELRSNEEAVEQYVENATLFVLCLYRSPDESKKMTGTP